MWTFYNASGEALVQHAESEATQAEMEAETAVAKFVPPDLVKNSPGVAKVWAKFTQASSQSMTAEYGVDTIADGGAAGYTDFTFDTNFSGTATYALVGTASAAGIVGLEDGSQAAGAVTIRQYDVDGSYGDSAHVSIVLYGDQ